MATDINFFEKTDSFLFKKINSKRDIISSEKVDGYFINSDENELRKITEYLKSSKEKKLIAIEARDQNFNRRMLETIKFDYLVSPEFDPEKDTLKQRSSGLNHVLTNLAKTKGISILMNLSKLKRQDKKTQAILISRILQNIKLCRKSKCSIKIANFSDKDTISEKERKLIGTSWGMSSQQTALACTFEKV